MAVTFWLRLGFEFWWFLCLRLVEFYRLIPWISILDKWSRSYVATPLECTEIHPIYVHIYAVYDRFRRILASLIKLYKVTRIGNKCLVNRKNWCKHPIWRSSSTAFQSSDFVSADLSVKSPWKLFIIYIENSIHRVRVSQKYVIWFREQSHCLKALAACRSARRLSCLQNPSTSHAAQSLVVPGSKIRSPIWREACTW